MLVQLNRPEINKFIDDQVKAGHFPTAEAAVEAAIENMMRDQAGEELDDETADAINRAEEQIARGEGIDYKMFAAEMRKKFVER